MTAVVEIRRRVGGGRSASVAAAGQRVVGAGLRAGRAPATPRSRLGLEREAAALRWRLGLGPLDRLDPLELAAAVPALVFTPEEFGDELLARRLRQVPWDGLSFTIPGAPALIVIMNPDRPATRRTATLLEELAHALLRHRPSTIGPDPRSGVLRRSYDAAQEREAFELGAALLLPRELVAAELRARRSVAAIARRHRCSEALVLFRIRRLGLSRLYEANTAAA
jgi:hypothetical protein